MEKLLLQNKVYALLGVLIIVFTILFIVYWKGRKDGSTGGFWDWLAGGDPDPDPTNGSANPGQADVPDVETTNNTGSTNTYLISLSNQLSQYLNEYCIACTSRCKAYDKALLLSDDEFKQLANYFKNTNRNTLREAINDTKRTCRNDNGTNTTLKMTDRLDELLIP